MKLRIAVVVVALLGCASPQTEPEEQHSAPRPILAESPADAPESPPGGLASPLMAAPDAPLAEAATARPLAAHSRMIAHFINVGQAAAALLEFPCGAVLVDAGAQNDDAADDLVQYLDGFFNHREDLNRTLDVVYVTHPHVDHNRALEKVASAFTVKNYVDDGRDWGSGKTMAKWIREKHEALGIKFREVGDLEIQGVADRSGLTDQAIDPVTCDDCDPRIVILSASLEDNLGWPDGDFENSNNHSLVIRVDFGESSFLFTGDLETHAIETMVDYYSGTSALDVDVYHVGHHGSANGTTEGLIAAMTPEAAVISCGPHTDRDPWTAYAYGHPRKFIIDMLEAGITRDRSSSIEAMVAEKVKTFKRRQIRRAIYATAWDGSIRISAAMDGSLRVTRKP